MAFQPIRADKTGYHYQPVRGQTVPGGGGPGPEPPEECCDVLSGTFATRPAAANDCDLYLPTDAFQVTRDNGSAWVPWGDIFKLTVPPSTGWSWVNQLTSTITIDKNSHYLACPTAGNVNCVLRVRDIPSTPYTLTTVMLNSQILVEFWYGNFIVIRDSGTGRFVTFGYRNSAAGVFWLIVDEYNSPTNWQASPKTTVNPRLTLSGFRLYDDGVNFNFYYSQDMRNWLLFYSGSRTEWLANPTQIGFGMRIFNTYESSMQLLSWEVT